MADTLIPVVAAYTGAAATALRELTSSEDIPDTYIPTTMTGHTLVTTTFTNYTETLYATGSTGATKTIDLANGTMQLLTLDQACTITLPVTTAGKSFTLVLTGNFAPTWAAGSGRTLKWAGGTAPARTASAGKYDIYVFSAVDSTDTLGCDGGRSF